MALVLVWACPEVAEPWTEKVVCQHRIETHDRGLSIFPLRKAKTLGCQLLDPLLFPPATSTLRPR